LVGAHPSNDDDLPNPDTSWEVHCNAAGVLTTFTHPHAHPPYYFVNAHTNIFTPLPLPQTHHTFPYHHPHWYKGLMYFAMVLSWMLEVPS
jgi:hypothetical protein